MDGWAEEILKLASQMGEGLQHCLRSFSLSLACQDQINLGTTAAHIAFGPSNIKQYRNVGRWEKERKFIIALIFWDERDTFSSTGA